MHLHGGFILVHSGVFDFIPPSQSCGYMTLDAAKWNGAGCELMCYKQYSMGSCIIIFETLSEQIFQLTFYPFLFYVLIYMFMFLMYYYLHA